MFGSVQLLQDGFIKSKWAATSTRGRRALWAGGGLGGSRIQARIWTNNEKSNVYYS